MILYDQGVPYWHEMRKYNASKALPGMTVQTVENMQKLLTQTTSTAVRNRIHGFIARHGPRPFAG